LSTIADALSNSIANYYNPSQSSKPSTAEKQQLKFKVGISDSPILVKVYSSSKSLEPISITEDTVNDSIILNGNS
jgi:hypothetical protein